MFGEKQKPGCRLTVARSFDFESSFTYLEQAMVLSLGQSMLLAKVVELVPASVSLLARCLESTGAPNVNQ